MVEAKPLLLVTEHYLALSKKGRLVSVKLVKRSLIDRICVLSGIQVLAPEGATPGEMIPERQSRAFFRAWGIDGADEKSTEAVVADLHRDHWQRLIPPVLVIEETTCPIVVPIHLPRERFALPLRWAFIAEDGVVREGTVSLGEKDILEEAQVDGVPYVSLQFALRDLKPAAGYHRFQIESGGDGQDVVQGQCTMISAPARCYLPPGLARDARIWGVSCHLETVRSRRNWGMGDLTDLHNILRWAAENGAGTVAVTSLLSRALAAENQWYPPLPSSPWFLDPVYLDLEAVADFHESEEAHNLVNDPAFQVHLASLRESEQVEFGEVAAIKTGIAEALWRHFQDNHLDPETERGWGYRTFQQAGGQRLHTFALLATLREEVDSGEGKEGFVLDSWAEALLDPASPAIADFARTHQDRLEYHQYLQWQLELQLAEVGRRSLELGLKVGLTQTLPAGLAPDGFAGSLQPRPLGTTHQVYCRPEAGHPPVHPLIPVRITAESCEAYIAMLRCSMKHAGALRLGDIGMLDRQQWQGTINGETTTALVAPPAMELLAIIALESRKNRCLIIAEHSGPLSEHFAETLRGKGILLCRPGYFERNRQGEWLSLANYPAQSVVLASRYDLGSLTDFWQGRDIALMTSGWPSFTSQDRERAIIARAADRAHLLVALKREELLPQECDIDPASVPVLTQDLMDAVQTFLDRSPAQIFLANLSDLSLSTEQADAMSRHRLTPVWKQREPIELESMVDDERLQHLFRTFCQERSIGVVRPSAPLFDRRRRQRHVIPGSFYRLQFNRQFTFLQAAACIPYLKELGITHCYASPYLKARPGSSHGYDIIDHGSLNPEIGSREDYEEFVAALDRHEMAQILDMVPNHMGVGADNTWWVDVLENGQASAYAHFFDINWQASGGQPTDRLLLPVLGDHFGVVLEQGELHLIFQADRGCFHVTYFDHVYPVAPETYPLILGHDLQRLETRLGGEHEGFLELQSLISSFASLPRCVETSAERVEMRRRNKEVLKRLLARLCREHSEIGTCIIENVIFYNGEPGRPESFDSLEALLALQAYRLAFWRVASDEINYRRFFDINDLAGICMERRDVFEQTHGFVIDLIATGKVDGLRIDHPDGLYDPEGYFRNLQAAVSGTSLGLDQAAGPEPVGPDQRKKLPLYVVVEKILSEGELVPSNWLVHGTTGYDFSCLLNGLFIDRDAEQEMTALYHRFIGQEFDFSVLVHDCKRLIMKTAMAGEINVLSDHLYRLAKKNRSTQDYTLNSLREALAEIVAFFPVYRAYCTGDSFTATSRQYVESAVHQAIIQHRAEDTSIYDFIKSVLMLDNAQQQGERQRQLSLDFVMKFQQYTGPIMAKGLEDTAFYIYNRLLSLNEVGGDPCRFGVSVGEFHAANQVRNQQWPHAMLNTSTHDSKRSEDVRARINVLSEMTTEWGEALGHWQELNREKKTTLPDSREAVPSNNEEYALYQNLLGVWPFAEIRSEDREVFRDRFAAYMLKTIREAKVHTSWLNQNHEHENAMLRFITRLLDETNEEFLDAFRSFQDKIAKFGMINSLSQLLLKLTAPGVPDIYQGNEIWSFCLVDPDNRHPVDFDKRWAMLTELRQTFDHAEQPLVELVGTLLQTPDDGRVKMYVSWKTLTCRRQHPDLFEQGGYISLQAAGGRKEHVCAFLRKHGETTLLVAVPRLVAQLLDKDATRMPLGREVWDETRLLLPEGIQERDFENVLTGEKILGRKRQTGLYAADLFANFPLALLMSN